MEIAIASAFADVISDLSDRMHSGEAPDLSSVILVAKLIEVVTEHIEMVEEG